MVRAEPDAIAEALTRLEDRALAWRSVGGLRALTGVAEVLAGGPAMSGLLPFSAEPLTATQVRARLEEVSERARRLLDHVADHGGEATTGTARITVTPAEAETPAEELISRRLLIARGEVARLPGEVALVLRGGRTTADPVDVPPVVPGSPRPARLVEQAAAGAVLESVRRVEQLMERWASAPPVALRNGGLGVRDLKAIAADLGVDEPTAALLVETAVAAGLATTAAAPSGSPAWMPTDHYDDWLGLSSAARWVQLARAWLVSPRMPALVGHRDPSGKAWNALVPELAGVFIAETRRGCLRVLAELPDGEVLAPGTGPAALVARLGWERPRRPHTRGDQVEWTLREAATLGVVALGGLTGHGRRLVADEDPTEQLAMLLPDPVDHVLLQADLTAVAPGPPTAELGRWLALAAEVESRGGAEVHRFTKDSVRRAMEAGWSAAELHTRLAEVSTTPVPQPLSYLIDDVARTFGTTRVGLAAAYLRAEDESALSELLAHPGAAGLGLRRLAPTVLISTTPLDVLLPRLRELGAAPVLEAPDGSVHVSRPDALRARTPRDRPPASPGRESAHETARIAAVVAGVRAGDRASDRSADRSAGHDTLSTPATIAALQEAIDAGAAVVVGYVDDQGVAAERTVTPAALDSGQLVARDGDGLRSFALSRIRTLRTT
ncbi:MAG: helicase-associated domain-containing protein [Nocardioides sp.]|uniref:helicase-associated domain-containing protein n=1 Tax=Nocardioides sp. TaxID=35761 RepID=UPI0039E47AF0